MRIRLLLHKLLLTFQHSFEFMPGRSNLHRSLHELRMACECAYGENVP